MEKVAGSVFSELPVCSQHTVLSEFHLFFSSKRQRNHVFSPALLLPGQAPELFIYCIRKCAVSSNGYFIFKCVEKLLFLQRIKCLCRRLFRVKRRAFFPLFIGESQDKIRLLIIPVTKGRHIRPVQETAVSFLPAFRIRQPRGIQPAKRHCFSFIFIKQCNHRTGQSVFHKRPVFSVFPVHISRIYRRRHSWPQTSLSPLYSKTHGNCKSCILSVLLCLCRRFHAFTGNRSTETHNTIFYFSSVPDVDPVSCCLQMTALSFFLKILINCFSVVS